MLIESILTKLFKKITEEKEINNKMAWMVKKKCKKIPCILNFKAGRMGLDIYNL